MSEDTHAILAALATCSVRVAGVSRERKGLMRTEDEGEMPSSLTLGKA